MPLAVKPISHDDAKADVDTVLTHEEQLSQFVRTEIDRALRDVDRRKRLAEAALEQRVRHASRRIVSSGHRLERSFRQKSKPVLAIAIGLSLVGLVWLISQSKQEFDHG